MRWQATIAHQPTTPCDGLWHQPVPRRAHATSVLATLRKDQRDGALDGATKYKVVSYAKVEVSPMAC